MDSIKIFPPPKKIEMREGVMSAGICLEVNSDNIVNLAFKERSIEWDSLLSPYSSIKASVKVMLKVEHDSSLKEEAYRLNIMPESIELKYGSPAGAYYGIITLLQIFNQCSDTSISCMTVEDYPSLLFRGILIDIGRNKIPTVKTLKQLIRQFALMKINHVQFYMDGYCYKWPGYQYLFSDETPITADELKELVSYAKANFICLTPNLNSLGHMEQWMEKPQLRHFAECEDGFDFQSLYRRAPGTIYTGDQEAFEWVTSLFDELLVNFDSEFINANLDEPFELGKGKSKADAEKYGIHAPYIKYVKKMRDYCDNKGKKMMMWGDVLVENPETLQHIASDIIILHWMYEGAGEFEPAAKSLENSGLDFILCPGTSSWCSFTGRSESMRRNIEDAVINAINYNGKGILLTDWGDAGHWQYISTSYIPFAFGAGYSWSGKSLCKESVFDYCNSYFFGDDQGKASETIYRLGNYYVLEDSPLISTTLCCGIMIAKHKFDSREGFLNSVNLMLSLCRNLSVSMDIKLPHFDIQIDVAALKSYMESLIKEVSELNLTVAEGSIIKEEMLNAGRFALHGLRLYNAMTSDLDNVSFSNEMTILFKDMDEILKKHFDLWIYRNKTGGFRKSTEQLLHLMNVYFKYRTC